MASELASALLRRARAWAGQITRQAKALAPDHLKSHIHSEARELKEGHITVTTYVDKTADSLPNYGTEDAHAQEFGSGLHARRGKKGKYVIRPKNPQGLLAFEWEVANANPENFTFAPDGRVTFHQVKHPGIQAANSGKGYIGPVWNAVRKKAKEEIGIDVGKSIKLTLNRSFKGK